MYGADSAELEDLARQIDSANGELRQLLREGAGAVSLVGLSATIGSVWRGPRSADFSAVWQSRHLLRIREVQRPLDAASRSLRANAEHQRTISRASASAPSLSRPLPPRPNGSAESDAAVRDTTGWLDPGGVGVTRADLKRIRDRLAGLDPDDRSAAILALGPQLHRLRDQMQESPNRPFNTGGYHHHEMAEFYRLVAPGLHPDALDLLLGENAPGEAVHVGKIDVGDGTAQHALADMIDATDEGGPAQGAIQIRQLDSGAYVVILPGVVDLSDGLEAGLGAALAGGAAGGALGAAGGALGAALGSFEGENAKDSPRDMYHARRAAMGDVDGSSSYSNGYAFMVKAAMAKHGVPEGSDVMLVGHSFGAYTALELANDPGFNGVNGGYQVTNVVAAGADVDWMADDVPAAIDVLVLNNESDAAYEVERKLSREGVPDYEVLFDAGRSTGAGHKPSNYSDFVREGEHQELDHYLATLPEQYRSTGDAYNIQIRDPYRHGAVTD